jgi:mRNA-degrading endonuclease RelE of RelBE toxin-antitoxin system
MSYSISITRSAQKALAKIDKGRRADIVNQINALSHNPRPVGSKKTR